MPLEGSRHLQGNSALLTHFSLDLWLLSIFFFNAARLKVDLFLCTSLSGVFRESLQNLLDLLIATKAEPRYLTFFSIILCPHCLSRFGGKL